MSSTNTEIQDGSAKFKVRSVTDLVKNIEDLQTENAQLTDKLTKLTTIQKVNVSFDSAYVTDVNVYKAGHVVHGSFSFYRSTAAPDIPIITNLPKTVAGWGAVVTPLHAHSLDGIFLRVHMNAGETVLNLHYSESWQTTQGNEAELSFLYITPD